MRQMAEPDQTLNITHQSLFVSSGWAFLCMRHHYCITKLHLYTCNTKFYDWTLIILVHFLAITDRSHQKPGPARSDHCVTPCLTRAAAETPRRIMKLNQQSVSVDNFINLRNHMHVLSKLAKEFSQGSRLLDNYNLSHLLHCVRRQRNATSPGRSIWNNIEHKLSTMLKPKLELCFVLISLFQGEFI